VSDTATLSPSTLFLQAPCYNDLWSQSAIFVVVVIVVVVVVVVVIFVFFLGVVLARGGAVVVVVVYNVSFVCKHCTYRSSLHKPM
jgi:hypothetical protein